MNKWDKLLQEFIGKDKVESISIVRNEEGRWIYKYRERIDGEPKYNLIECPDRKTAEDFHFQFGGKNPSSVSAPEKFNKIGDWRSEQIMEKGHRVAEIRVVGIRNVRNSSIPITLPDGTGYEHLVGKKKKVQNNQVKLVLRDNELCNMTRVFTRHRELDTFIEFLQTNESLKNLTFHVDLLTLENEETKEVGRWERCRAKDGTNRMVLELKKINGKKYTEFMYSQILAYSDGMADAECRKIPKPKAKPKDDTVCYFAAKDGAFDG